MKTAPVCPRCGGFIPSNANAGKYPGAISRLDNETEICSDCGTEEALGHLNDPWPAKSSAAMERYLDAYWLAAFGDVVPKEEVRG